MLDFSPSNYSLSQPLDELAANYTEALRRLVQAQRLGSEQPSGRQRGALIDLLDQPAKPVILIGDLHARYDNLLAILGHNGNHQRLERGEIYVITLGDEVHRKEIEYAREMRSSIEMLRLICDLKWDNPHNFYSLVGTHSFLNTGYSKWKVHQGEVMHDYIMQHLGPEYLQLYEEYVKKGALAAVGMGFVAVHAGPSYSVESLADIENVPIADDPPIHPQHPVVHDLTYFRFGMNYSLPQVNRFLEACGQPGGKLITGHQVGNGGWLDQFTYNHFALSAAGDKLGYVEIHNGKVTFHEVPESSIVRASLPPPAIFTSKELADRLPQRLEPFNPLCLELGPTDRVSVELGKDDIIEFSLLNNGSAGLALTHRKSGILKRLQGGVSRIVKGERIDLDIGTSPNAFALTNSFGTDVSDIHIKVKFQAPRCLTLIDFCSLAGSAITSWR